LIFTARQANAPVMATMGIQSDKPEKPDKPKSRKRAHKIEDFYQPFPRQKQFHDSTAKYRLFGGAAGPGKTKALLYEAILQAHKHPGVDTMLLRRTFSELESSLLTYFRRDVPRDRY
jgi:hypothetical protein